MGPRVRVRSPADPAQGAAVTSVATSRSPPSRLARLKPRRCSTSAKPPLGGRTPRLPSRRARIRRDGSPALAKSARPALRDQIERASSSIALTLAEGCARRTRRDRHHFFSIAQGSAMECAVAARLRARHRHPSRDWLPQSRRRDSREAQAHAHCSDARRPSPPLVSGHAHGARRQTAVPRPGCALDRFATRTTLSDRFAGPRLRPVASTAPQHGLPSATGHRSRSSSAPWGMPSRTCSLKVFVTTTRSWVLRAARML
jgi:hypothetical protein